MADIISLDEVLQNAREKQATLLRKRKALALRRISRNAPGGGECMKCGEAISPDPESNPDLRVPYRFCGGCAEEYIDYIDRLLGKGDLDCYWHNDHWMETWKQWTEYQSAVDNYIKTKEFKQLLSEVSRSNPDA